jgi:hypothetical protein
MMARAHTTLKKKKKKLLLGDNYSPDSTVYFASSPNQYIPQAMQRTSE